MNLYPYPVHSIMFCQTEHSKAESYDQIVGNFEIQEHN